MHTYIHTDEMFLLNKSTEAGNYWPGFFDVDVVTPGKVTTVICMYVCVYVCEWGVTLVIYVCMYLCMCECTYVPMPTKP